MKKSAAMLASTILVAGLAASASAGSVTVKATNANTFKPKIANVSDGTKVVWKNPSSRTHNVTATSKNWTKSATIAVGSATSFTFKKSGKYRYRCTLHSTLSSGKCSGMCGKVIVA